MTIPTSARQIIRVRVAETRRVPLSEVPYPRSNLTFYQYLLECGEVSQHQYNHLVFRHHYPLTEQSRDHRRNRRNNVNRNNPVTYERIIVQHGERLSESNNSLCRECLMPIVLGEELCNECQQEQIV